MRTRILHTGCAAARLGKLAGLGLAGPRQADRCRQRPPEAHVPPPATTGRRPVAVSGRRGSPRPSPGRGKALSLDDDAKAPTPSDRTRGSLHFIHYMDALRCRLSGRAVEVAQPLGSQRAPGR